MSFSKSFLKQNATRSSWLSFLESGEIRPYIYARKDCRVAEPGARHSLDWFNFAPLLIDPLDSKQIGFAEKIYILDNAAFGPAAMPIPRWVFYDCGVMPGYVAGYAMKTEVLSTVVKNALPIKNDKGSQVYHEWTPLSLFIIIPTMKSGEWVAHNLCTINSIIPNEKERFHALGFLTKAFGLWYGNIETCLGMTQLGNSALKLHSSYGHLQVLTAYTPVHSHPNTITYRCEVNSRIWGNFFTKNDDLFFHKKFENTEMTLDPKALHSQIQLQDKIQNGEGPYFLSASDIAQKKTTEPLVVYKLK